MGFVVYFAGWKIYALLMLQRFSSFVFIFVLENLFRLIAM